MKSPNSASKRGLYLVLWEIMAMSNQSEGTVNDVLTSLPACPVETTLALIGNKWQVLIVRDLMEGTKRFKELQRSVGSVSQKVLTANLRTMEAQGLVRREVFAEVPPRVEYSLTELGRSLRPVIDALWNWGESYKERLGHNVV